MRDPARIKPFLEKLEQFWFQHPDLRLGQIIDHSHNESDTKYTLFGVEDDILEKGLDELIELCEESKK